MMIPARPLNLAKRHGCAQNAFTLQRFGHRISISSFTKYQPRRILRVYIIAALGSPRDAMMHTVQASRPAVHVTNAPIRQAC